MNAVALVPARSGSVRIPGKNLRSLAGHPLVAYAIAAAGRAGVFERVVVSTDSEEVAAVARHYGADVPFLRPPELATATSPDIEWIAFTLEHLPERYDLFAIVRPTNPFRGARLIEAAVEQLVANPHLDSIRAVEPARQHPGKMWTIAPDGRTMTPLLDQTGLAVPWHSSQFAALPPVYVQNAALEVVWTRVVAETGTHAGRTIAPLITEGYEGFNIDYEDDWRTAEGLVAAGSVSLPEIEIAPYPPSG